MFQMNLNLYHRATRQQLVGLSMKVQKKLLESSKRYDMLFLVRYDKLNINVEGDLSTSPEEKLCKVIVSNILLQNQMIIINCLLGHLPLLPNNFKMILILM